MSELSTRCQGLVDILKNMKTVLSKMLEIEDEKYEALRAVDFENLLLLGEFQEEILNKFENLELKRRDYMIEFSIILGISPDSPVSAFAAKFPKELGVNILEICREIRVLMDQLSTATDRNSYILSVNSDILIQILDMAVIKSGDHYDSQGLSKDTSLNSLYTLDHLV